MRLTTAHRSRPCRGETLSGDAVLVRREGNDIMLAVIDALGHGPGAADVANHALSFLQAASVRDGVRPIMESLHRALWGTRGAAATVCLVSGGELEFAGVGNVGLRVFGTPFSALLSAGVLGGRLRDLRVLRGKLQSPTRLVLYSDGVRGELWHDAPQGTPAEACDAILQRHGLHYDDATILIADIQ